MVDARGYSCPMPVAMVQKAVRADSPEELVVLVDDPCAVENVTRFANNQGYEVEKEANGEEYRLTLRK